MVDEIERSTRFGEICEFAWLILWMAAAIGAQFFPYLSIRIFYTFVCSLLFAFVLKREIIPCTNHMKRASFDGEWITGKVNLKTIQYSGGRYLYGYTIEGYYTYHERIYMFQDHFYITDTLADCAFKDIFANENVPADIMILVDPVNPVKYMVKGALYMQCVRDAFPEYFEKWHHK